MAILKEIPENIEMLVKDANCKNSWKTRLAALNILKNYDCQQSRDVITRLAIHDKVYIVKEEGFRAAQAFGIMKNGTPIRLGKKDIGYLNKDFTKLFQQIKRAKKMDDLDIDVFKATLEIINPEMYDVMEYENGNKFNSWIEKIYKSLPKK